MHRSSVPNRPANSRSPARHDAGLLRRPGRGLTADDRRDRAVFAPAPRLCTAPRWPRAAAELRLYSTTRTAITAPELRDDFFEGGQAEQSSLAYRFEGGILTEATDTTWSAARQPRQGAPHAGNQASGRSGPTERGSLTAAYPWRILTEGSGWRARSATAACLAFRPGR